MKTYGSRAEVWHGKAKKTRGKLTKKNLFKKNGRIKSKRASIKAKKRGSLKKWAKENNLVQKKGEFGWFEKE